MDREVKRNWFSTAYHTPSKSGLYDVLTENGGHDVMNWSAYHQAWNQHDRLPKNDKEIKVVAYAYRESTQEILANMIEK